jgi:hypothetical protein
MTPGDLDRHAARMLLAGFAACLLAGPSLHAQGTLEAPLPWRPVPQMDVVMNFALAVDPDRKCVVRYGGHRLQPRAPEVYGEVWEWDGSRWWHRPAAVKPPPRTYAAMAFDPIRRRIVMFGGTQNRSLQAEENITLGDFWEWDGRTWREIRTQVAPSPRLGATMVTDPVRKKVVLFGGGDGSDLLGSPIPNDETWEWDGVQWRQIAPSRRPWARCFANMAYHPPTGRIVMMGNWYLEKETWFYDGVDWTSQILDPRPYTYGNNAMAYDATTGKLVFHGVQYGGKEVSKTWLWDGAAWADVTPPNPPPISYALHRLVEDPITGGVLYVYGASYESSPQNYVYRISHETWRWRGIEAHSWKRIDAQACLTGPHNAGMRVFSAVHDSIRDEFVLVGVSRTPPSSQDATHTLTWSDATGAVTRNVDSSIPVRPGYMLAMHLGIQRVVGIETDANGRAVATRLWDGTAWQQWTGGPTPIDAYSGRHVYDSRRQKIVVIRGDGRILEWDPAGGWQDCSSDPRPPKREGTGTLAYDAARGRVVMFGGFTGGNTQQYLDDTWEWDGARWHPMTPAFSPSPRSGHLMAYAPWLGGVVLAAGEYVVKPKPWIHLPRYPDDLWLWDGVRWTRLGAGGYPANTGYFSMVASPSALIADVGRQRLRLFFGNGAPSESLAWDLELRPLSADPLLPRPGEPVQFRVRLPQDASRPFAMLLSGAAGPGVPLYDAGGLGPRRLPLGPDPLLSVSLQLGLVQMLDAQGQGAWALPLPPDAGLIGTRFHAAGLTLAPGPAFGSITNRIQLDVVR